VLFKIALCRVFVVWMPVVRSPKGISLSRTPATTESGKCRPAGIITTVAGNGTVVAIFSINRFPRGAYEVVIAGRLPRAGWLRVVAMQALALLWLAETTG
jgi:hypothetical protein